jgi:hypothetical protein
VARQAGEHHDSLTIRLVRSLLCHNRQHPIGRPMTTLAIADDVEIGAPQTLSPTPSSRLFRIAPHVVVWTLFLAPMIRNMARGWRPLGDDATIAIGAWRALSLHPPLLGQLTSATGGTNASDPGPLEYWLLGPFTPLDAGQGVLIGSAVLCALVLTVTIELLWRTSGPLASVIFTFVICDMAIVSPTPFVDPVWNNSFGFFWFLGFLGVAFTVGRGHLRLVPLLLFMGSVAIDSNLLYLPTIALLLAMATLTGWLLRRPANYRWLGWTVVVAALCWLGPLYQQLFDARPNLSLLLHPTTKTEGWVFGLRALSRASALNPIWAAPRPIDELAANADILHRNVLLGVLVLFVLVGIAVTAWRHKQSALLSLSVVSLGAAVGVVTLFSRTPSNDLLAFIWVNLAVWLLGVGIWLTLCLAVVTALRPQWAEIRSQVAEVRTQLGRKTTRISGATRRTLVLLILGVVGVIGMLVTLFPYGNQFLVDFPGVVRVKQMTADIQSHVPRGNVGIGLIYRGPDFYQVAQDEHGVAYLLLTGGWTPGMEPATNQLLGLPIHRTSPFVVFTEHNTSVTGVRHYPVYLPFWFTKTG